MLTRSRYFAAQCAALGAGGLVLLQGCSDDGAVSGGGTSAGSGGAVSGGAPPATGGAVAGGGTVSTGGAAAGAGAGGAGGAEEPVFDASALNVDGSAGPPLCRLSGDGRYLLLSVQNTGGTETGPTAVRVSTDGTEYELRLETPWLNAGEGAELAFDRGPLVGFVDNWHFTVTVDPDGLHGEPHSTLQGECRDLRSRAAAGMVPLDSWYNEDTGLWHLNDWWTSANQLETAIDYSRQTGDPTYFGWIDNTFTKNEANDFDQWGYYDDDGWWAIAWIKAYDLSHQQKYLDMAKTIFARMAGGWTDQCGGGIYWASPKAGEVGNKNKNAIPNSLFMQVAAKLHLRTPGDSGPGSYLDWAQREWNWFKNTGMITEQKQIVDGLNNLTDCKAEGPIFTYNQGVLVGALVDLAAASGDAALLDEASDIAHATMTLMATEDGILLEPGCGGDICVQFKGVFMRNLAHLYQARPLPEFLTYMRHQSDQLWNANKNDLDQFGYEWHVPFDKATAGRQSSALDALIAAVSSSNLNLALRGSASGSTACSANESPSRAIDGSSHAGSKWCSGGSGGQTLSVDLGAAQNVVGFRLRHAGAGGENSAWNTRDFELQTSSDGQAWDTVVSVAGNTENVTTHPIPMVSARYARLHVSQAQTGTDFVAARIYELEVFGIAVE